MAEGKVLLGDAARTSAAEQLRELPGAWQKLFRDLYRLDVSGAALKRVRGCEHLSPRVKRRRRARLARRAAIYLRQARGHVSPDAWERDVALETTALLARIRAKRRKALVSR